MADGSAGAVQGGGWLARRPDAAVPRGSALPAVSDWLERERPQWFNWFPVALGAGIGLYFAAPVEPSAAAALAPLPVAVLFWRLVRRGSVAAMLLGLVATACLGLALAKLRADRVAAPVLERRMGPVEVRGFVEMIEPRETRGERLTIRVASIDGVAAEQTPRRVRVRAMNAPADGVVLKPGMAIKLKAHLAPPSAPVLPGGYDFARGAYFQGLGAIGYAMSRAEIDTTAGPPPDGIAWQAAIARLRQDISARVTAALPGQTGAIATALISGERGAISAATNDAYRDSGLYHVLSISGLHMAIMGGAVFFAVRILLALFPAIALNHPIKKWAAAAAIVASLGYLAISGAAFATVRSAVTITIMFVAVLLDRPAIAMRNVALSALLILLIWPESLTDVGFQMSFAAVVALVASYEALRRMLLGRARWPESVLAKLGLFAGGIVVSTLIASVAVAPFGAYYFHKGQQLAIIANVVATPVINLVIMPAALGALVLMPFGLEAMALAPMGFGIDLTTRVAAWVAALPGAATRIPAISLFSFVTIAAGGLWLLLWRERPRWLGLAVIAAGGAFALLTPHPDILVGRDGLLVAARTSGGRFGALPAPQASFELSRWLEHDGDARSVKEAVAAATGFACDAAGCVTRVRGYTVAMPRHASAIADDCARADIVLLSVPKPKGCTRPLAVIDFFALRAQGTHAIFIDTQIREPTSKSLPVSSTRALVISSEDVERLPAQGTLSAPEPSEDRDPLLGSGSATTIAPGPDGRGSSPKPPTTKPALATTIDPSNADQSRKPSAIRIETVAMVRGDRPWSRLPWWARPRDGSAPGTRRKERPSEVARSGPGGTAASDPEGAHAGAQAGARAHIDQPTAGSQAKSAHSAGVTIAPTKQHGFTQGSGPEFRGSSGYRSRLWGFAASPEFLASQQIPRLDAEIEDALKDPSLYDERW